MSQIDATEYSVFYNAFEITSVAYGVGAAGSFFPSLLAWNTGTVAPFYTVIAYSSSGNIINSGGLTGTIDAISIIGDTGDPVLSFTDLTAQLSSLFLESGGQAGWEAFWETSLAGTTTINLGSNSMQLMGDFAVVNSGQTLNGAADRFTGTTFSANHKLIGDALRVDAGAILNGGADIFTFSSELISIGGSSLSLIGDAGVSGVAVLGTVNGGNDRFIISELPTLASPPSLNANLIGDVQSIGPSGSLRGGNDTFTITNIANLSLLAGDFEMFLGTTAVGGNDTINVIRQIASYTGTPTFFSLLSGDGVTCQSGTVRGGADAITVQNISGNALAGDALGVANANFTGGADTINCSNTLPVATFPAPPFSAPSISSVSGDAITTGGTGTFRGGNDRISFNGVFTSAIAGDVMECQNVGSFVGGNDIINNMYNYPVFAPSSLAIYGDAAIASNVNFSGGNDTITISGDRGLGSQYSVSGDVNTYSPAGPNAVFVCGDDTIRITDNNTSSRATIFGDADTFGGILSSFTGGDDIITAGAGNDFIYGDTRGSVTATIVLGGNDVLDGRGGNDVLDGGGGNNYATFASLAQSVYIDLLGIFGTGAPGGLGFYEAMGQGFDQFVNIQNVIGSALNDIIFGDDGINLVSGGNGNDRLFGRGGADTLNGGDGADFLFGGNGADKLYGLNGGDQLNGGLGADEHFGGIDGGVDYARYDDADYGNLTIRLDNAAANVGEAAVGDIYNSIEGLVGGVGNDTVFGNNSNNFLLGLNGIDLIYGLAGADYLNGGNGGDSLFGGLGADQHLGGNGAGVDLARYDDANYGHLTIRLDAPTSNVGAVAVGDTYTGIEGLVGGLGNDIVIGNAANNFLYGGGGVDYIDGRLGNDNLNGGAGADRFVFATALNAATNVDRITDFTHASDDINLNQTIFASIGTSLNANELRLGTLAADANDFIIYNSTTGQIFYDANGNGAGGQTLFARVAIGTVLDVGDFVMV